MAVAPEAATPTTKWSINGLYYEFCSCNPGCTCNFAGFPTSANGGCQAVVATDIKDGACGEVDLSGVRCAAIVDWPKAIHEGNGRAFFVVEPETTDEQIDALTKIFTGQLGGNPWGILATTYQVVGLAKANIEVEDAGRSSALRIEGHGEARMSALKNPVTGEDNNVSIVLEEGFIWKEGAAAQGTWKMSGGPLELGFDGTSAFHAKINWAN